VKGGGARRVVLSALVFRIKFFAARVVGQSVVRNILEIIFATLHVSAGGWRENFSRDAWHGPEAGTANNFCSAAS